jgi:hypothetical protein
MTVHFFGFDESPDEVVILCSNCRGKGGWWSYYRCEDPYIYPDDWDECPECMGVGWFPYEPKENIEEK